MIKVEEEIIPIKTAFAKQYNLQLALDELNNPEKLIPTISIVGTNGKGSTATYLSQGLKQKYQKVGLFISPAFLYHNERIQVNNEPISDANLKNYLQKVDGIVKKYHLTFFEIWTLVMILYFVDQKVDIAVIEAGIGGAKDATKVMSQQLMVLLATVDFDHTEILGNSIQEILEQKIGIANLQTPVLISADNHIYHSQITEILNQKNLIGHWTTIADDEITYQKANKGLALAGLKYFGIDSQEQNWQPPLGRFTVLNQNPKWVLDGAHNLDGIKKLIQTLKNQKINPLILFATSLKKNYSEMLKLLNENFSEVYITDFEHPKAWTIEKINYPFKVINWQDFLWENKNRDVVICGSLYFIPQVYQWYQQQK